MGLTVDFSMGFVCFDAASKVSEEHFFINNKNMENRSFQWEISDSIVHSVMKRITTP